MTTYTMKVYHPKKCIYTYLSYYVPKDGILKGCTVEIFGKKPKSLWQSSTGLSKDKNATTDACLTLQK